MPPGEEALQLGDVQLEPGDVAVLDLPDLEHGAGLQSLIGPTC